MPYVTVGRENSGDICLYYEDHGAGPPVVLIHGYLSDSRAWEKQEPALLSAGFRVISYDRRGSGCSSRPASGYDYDTLAADLSGLLDQLDIQNAVLTGTCSGTGEVIRYLGAYGQRRIRATALLAPITPYWPEGDRPGGEPSFLDSLLAELSADRPAAIKTFLDLYYNIDLLGGTAVSDQAWQNSFHVAIRVSAAAALGCAAAWREDFRADLARISVPVLIIQGAEDRVMSPDIAGSRLAVSLRDAQLVTIPGGPHAITWTHAAQVNQALLRFLRG